MALAAWLTSIPQYSQASNIIDTVNSVVRAINAQIIQPLNSVIYPTIPSAPVNLLGVTVGNVGVGVTLTVDGSAPDTNASITLTGRGTGANILGSSTSPTQIVKSLAIGGATIGSNALAVTGNAAFGGAITILQANAGSFNAGQWSRDANWGTYYKAANTGAVADLGLFNNAGTTGLLIGSASVNFGGTSIATSSLEVDTVASANRRVVVSGSNGGNPTISTSAGSLAITPAVVCAAGITVIGGAQFLTTSSALTDYAAAQAATILNGPAAGNPTKWIGINDNGTVRKIPSW